MLLIWNKLKWFNVANNDDNVQANGKNYIALPASFTLPKGTHISNGNYQGGMNTLQDCEVTCAGCSDDYYWFYGKVVTDWNTYTIFDIGSPKSTIELSTAVAPWLVEKRKVTNVKWGGDSPLSHVYRWFRALVTRKVVIA